MLALATPPAFADPTPAELAFQRGRDLLKAGRTAEACTAFSQSLTLEFEYGTLYNLAGCDRKLGKLATALAAYRRLAAEDPNEGRRAKSAAFADELGRRVGKLVVEAQPIPPHDAKVVIVVDGEPTPAALGDELPIDAGRHDVRVQVTGYREAAIAITTRDDDLAHASAALEPTSTPTPPPPTPPTRPAPRPVEVISVRYTGHRLAGRLIAGAGLLLLTTSVGVSLYERSVYNTYVVGDHPVAFPPDSIERANHAVEVANAMTFVAAGGIVSIVTGMVMWLSSEKVTTVRPVYTGETVGLSIGGQF